MVFSPFKDLTDTAIIRDLICKGLQKSESSCREEDEGALADRLVEMCSSEDVSDTEARRASAVLHKLAMQWEDADTWAQASSVCPEGKVLQNIGVDGFVQAYKLFTSEFFEMAKPL